MTNGPNDELIDHEADGIRELDNALPRWWLYGFYVTIVFAVVYFTNYHVLPAPWFGRSSLAAEYTAEIEAAERTAASRPVRPGTVVAALTDRESLERGAEIFNGTRNFCHTCHRKDLGGLVGPDLTDDLWLHGCAPDVMVANVRAGFPIKGMLPYGSAQPLTDTELLQVVSYILSKRGSSPPNPKAGDPERDKACP